MAEAEAEVAVAEPEKSHLFRIGVPRNLFQGINLSCCNYIYIEKSLHVLKAHASQ